MMDTRKVGLQTRWKGYKPYSGTNEQEWNGVVIVGAYYTKN